MLKAVKFVPE